MQKLPCSSTFPEPSSCAVLGILGLVFTVCTLLVPPTLLLELGRPEPSFQPICLYGGRHTACLFRWDISLPPELQVTVNVTQALFPVRKGEKICLWIVSDVLPIVREDSIWWRITVLLKSCTSDGDLGQLLLPEMGDLSDFHKTRMVTGNQLPTPQVWMAWRGGWNSGSG